MNSNYYVYELVDPRTNIPFYIGFAKNKNRPLHHLKECQRWILGKCIRNINTFKLGRIKKLLELGYDFHYRFIFQTHDSDEAYRHEQVLIEHYGRLDIKTGILTNMSAGGRGCLNPSLETRKQLSIKNSKSLIEKHGLEKATALKNNLIELYKEPARLEQQRINGKKGAQHIRDNGWSDEAIRKRTETKRKKGQFNNDMSAAHSPEANQARAETRKRLGLNKSENAKCLHKPEIYLKRLITRVSNLKEIIESHYQKPISEELIILAKREKIIPKSGAISMISIKKYLIG